MPWRNDDTGEGEPAATSDIEAVVRSHVSGVPYGRHHLLEAGRLIRVMGERLRPAAAAGKLGLPVSRDLRYWVALRSPDCNAE